LIHLKMAIFDSSIYPTRSRGSWKINPIGLLLIIVGKKMWF